jgi:hypothetical protein
MQDRKSTAELAAIRAELAQAFAEISKLRGTCDDLAAQVTRLSAEAQAAHFESEVTRSKMDVAPELLDAFWQYRAGEEYARIYFEPHPLVSVCITTFNRAALLLERCLPSVLAQDYPNFEVVIVGDGCTDLTFERLKETRDTRLRFVNLPRTRELPVDPLARWKVAGADAANHSLELAKGLLYTYLDDDDEYLPGRLSKLVRHLQSTRAELVFHPFYSQPTTGPWTVNRANSFRHGEVTTGSMMELGWFKRVGWSPTAYLYGEPADWNRCRRIRYLGARAERHPDILLRHFSESKPGQVAAKAGPDLDELNLSKVVIEGFAILPYSLRGLWPDGWAAEEFAITVVPPYPSASLELVIEVSEHLPEGLQLHVVVGDRPTLVKLAPATINPVVLQLGGAENEPVRIAVHARSTWSPREVLDAPDDRRLAFRLVGLKLSRDPASDASA